MTASWLPVPRPPVDALLHEMRQAAARRTVDDRREHDGVCDALAAVARLEAQA